MLLEAAISLRERHQEQKKTNSNRGRDIEQVCPTEPNAHAAKEMASTDRSCKKNYSRVLSISLLRTAVIVDRDVREHRGEEWGKGRE